MIILRLQKNRYPPSRVTLILSALKDVYLTPEARKFIEANPHLIYKVEKHKVVDILILDHGIWIGIYLPYLPNAATVDTLWYFPPRAYLSV